MDAHVILIISSLTIYVMIFCGILRCFCDLKDLEKHNNDVEKQTFLKNEDLDFPEEDLNIRKIFFKRPYSLFTISTDIDKEMGKFGDMEIEE